MTAIDTIKETLDKCYEEAIDAGFDPKEHGEWEPVGGDFVAVKKALGRWPTREEWAEAGWPHVGSSIVGDGDAD